MKETILKRELQLTEDHHQTNINLPFDVIEPASKLTIHFAYNPDEAEEEVAKEKILAALQRFVPESEQKKWGNIERYLPLKNLITLSLNYEKTYVGAHHRKDNHQTIVISEHGSDKGFVKQAINAGGWEIQLNAHCIATKEVNVSIQVEVER
ncbi:hypothetical protein VXN63_06850 [Marinilactibacillus sp. XAAS-LB27]|uniref:hypothetical protein n=1 Tax=Marinilactibacillus sp. XAAS-LB27 TaxID=3114538 RepID=UPI002E19EFD6|nr:hypothetical protein [Marinilactibacillus sp. XAAS-LB27]